MRSVIIVEDRPELQCVLKSALSSQGYEVRSALDGTAMGELCAAKPPDLVITDIYMPEKDGLEVIIELRKEFPTVKIIAISGNVSANNALRVAETLGAQRTFRKPFQVPELVQAVRQLLD